MEELINSSNIMTRIVGKLLRTRWDWLDLKFTVSVFHAQHLDEEKDEWNNVAEHIISTLSSELWEEH